MYPSQHLFAGIIFSLILLFLFPQINYIGFLIIVFSNFLIDVDHYLYYVYKKKDLSLKNAYNWFVENLKKAISLPRKQRNETYDGFAFLHGIEILLILFFLGIFVSKYFLFAFIGIAFHLLLDIIGGTIYRDRIDKLSVLHDFFKYKKLKFIDDKE